jgi:predicted MFS family arabinose efflux permease
LHLWPVWINLVAACSTSFNVYVYLSYFCTKRLNKDKLFLYMVLVVVGAQEKMKTKGMTTQKIERIKTVLMIATTRLFIQEIKVPRRP